MSITQGSETEEMMDIFHMYDTRGDGTIDVSQLSEVVRASGLNPTEAALRKFEKANDNRLAFESFVPIYRALARDELPVSGRADTCIEALRVFDHDGNGFIHAGELRHLLTSLGEKMTATEVDFLLAGSEDHRGSVNYSDLVNRVVSG